MPTLPAGWAYGGWAVTGGEPVTTGRFTAVDVADLAAPFSGPTAGPPFPGEDFLMNAPAGLVFPTDLAGGLAVISIEPEPDDSPAPFTLKPLMGGIDERNFRNLTPDEMKKQWEVARKGAGRQFILAPGCSVPNETTDQELRRLSELLTV